GKSTVCRLFEQNGIAVYDSDARAKALMAEDATLREQLVEAFGAECYNEQGLNRAYLAGRVFGDEAELQRLNGIVHPAVKEDFRRWADAQRGAYVVLESAILFESGFDTQVNTTLAVMAPMEERLRRTVERDGVDREAVRRRMEHQLSDDELHARAARTIVNLRMDYLESDVEQLHKIYCYEASL
ncbi:MAG: dephospho-CoA kinase, partial [Alistipes sp.]|nr:dephospho-CoA kinase [Alistipes sp.]